MLLLLVLLLWAAPALGFAAARSPAHPRRGALALASSSPGDRKVESRAAGALAGGLIAGPLGALAGLAIGDALRNKDNKAQSPQASSPEVAEARAAYANLQSALAEAASTKEMQMRLIEQRRVDQARLQAEADKLYAFAKQCIMDDKESSARSALEQRLALQAKSEALTKVLEDEERRAGVVEQQIGILTERLRTVESLMLRLKEQQLQQRLEDETGSGGLDPLEERFKRLERGE